ALTDLPNRRAFETALASEIKAAQADNEPLSVAFCDVDHFKLINDKHGHHTGDRVLIFIARLLSALSSDRCHIARHGGEEFVVLFRGLSVDAARDAMDGVRADLEARKLVDAVSGDRIVGVTISAGVADIFAYDNPREALRVADQALYAAKNDGRNRVYCAGQSASADHAARRVLTQEDDPSSVHILAPAKPNRRAG
ncbi:MAG: GGDEF domain-containing protein, partial [Sphingopyxis sp.]